jgi:predicted pyridoxine 5'-phosphate oxidase superfamily flavin-nucleotide-binding protein
MLPRTVSEAWDNHEGPIVMTTVNRKGVPNAIYATYAKKLDDGRIAVADNYFSKTRENIQTGSKASILFITKDSKSYQIKGPIEYIQEGRIYEDMKTWVESKHPCVAVALVRAEEAYNGGASLL